MTSSEFNSLKDVKIFKVSTGEPRLFSDLVAELATRGRCLMPLTTHYGDLSSFELCQKLNHNLADIQSKGNESIDLVCTESS